MFRISGFSRAGVLICGLTLAMLAPFGAAQAASFKLLYAFKGYPNDGSGPFAGLMVDAAGNLYGTTVGGGTSGTGTVFKLAPDGIETVLHAFAGASDGNQPSGGLIEDKTGNLFGTTVNGGRAIACGLSGPVGCGVVFKLAADGAETLLYAFSTGTGGEKPYSNLIANKDGDLYGTTSRGGASRDGTVFKLSPDGAETVLHAFSGRRDGALPYAGLIKDKSGNLYGTTNLGGGTGCGGDGCGTVFKLAPHGAETVLLAFKGRRDGRYPVGGLILRDGFLYGTASSGGSDACGGKGCGTVFRLGPDGTETVLYAFAGGNDGASPHAGLVADNSGNLYGTTNFGGGTGCNKKGCGTVFALAPDGTEKVLYAFKGGHDGYYPVAGLILRDGRLFGTASSGGTDGNGTIFQVRK